MHIINFAHDVGCGMTSILIPSQSPAKFDSVPEIEALIINIIIIENKQMFTERIFKNFVLNRLKANRKLQSINENQVLNLRLKQL